MTTPNARIAHRSQRSVERTAAALNLLLASPRRNAIKNAIKIMINGKVKGVEQNTLRVHSVCATYKLRMLKIVSAITKWQFRSNSKYTLIDSKLASVSLTD